MARNFDELRQKMSPERQRQNKVSLAADIVAVTQSNERRRIVKFIRQWHAPDASSAELLRVVAEEIENGAANESNE